MIDEVQKESSILEDTKQIVDASDERGLFILSGSQKLDLMKGMSESLAGRVSVSELLGLSMREIKGISFNRHFVTTEEYISDREKELKSYANEGMDYSFNIFYYRGRDKKPSGEDEIDLVIEENGVVYPIEIKMTGNPKPGMAAANTVLDKIPGKQRGLGAIICMIDKKTYLKENRCVHFH